MFLKGFTTLLTLIVAHSLYSSNVAKQTITITVLPVNNIEITGSDPNFEMTPSLTSTGGETVFVSSISYTVQSNDGAVKKITGNVDSELPEGLCLYVSLSQPTGAIAKGFVELKTRESDLVTEIPPNSNVVGATVTYKLTCLDSKAQRTFSRDIFFTLTDN